MYFLFLTLFSILSAIHYVAAHGYVSEIAIDGTWYAGNLPNNYKGPSPIRLIDDIGPVKGASNPDLNCGLGAALAEMVVPANPGSTVSILWSGGDGTSNWPHNTGPLMTYMASCGDTPCNQFNGSDAQWFKIDQLGKKPDGSTWYQADISTSRDAYDVTIPQSIAPGGYLIRHEIIALHLAVSLGGAEFYPMCIQVQIGGNGNGVPQSTVSFPGAYNDNDPGIFDPSIYDPGSNYTFPGGPISNLAASAQSVVAGPTATPPFPSGTAVSDVPLQSGSGAAYGGSSPTPTSGSDGSAQPSAPAPTGADSDGSGTGSCSLKARSPSSNKKRHYKRFMKRIMPHKSH